GPGVFVEDRFRDGPLSQDRTHVLKIFATWVPTAHVSIGGYLRTQSGQPWEARGRDWYDGYRRYLEPAGTHRHDAWTNVDVPADHDPGVHVDPGVVFLPTGSYLPTTAPSPAPADSRAAGRRPGGLHEARRRVDRSGRRRSRG